MINFKTAVYRTKQFMLDINPPALTPAALSQIKAQLSESEQQLFYKYSPADQFHAYRVFQLLHEAGHTNSHLLTAALLHDIGKSRYKLTAWDRIWPVLVKKIFPTLYNQWGDDAPTGWKRPFVIIKHHPAWGANMAQQARSHPTVIALIHRHQDKIATIKTEEDHLLTLLQWSDNQN